MLTLCDASLLSVGFHQSKTFIMSALNMVSNLFSRKDLSTDMTSKGIDILLCLFSHKKNGVRLTTYSHCLEILTVRVLIFSDLVCISLENAIVVYNESEIVDSQHFPAIKT